MTQIETLRPAAMGLPADAVKQPDIPIAVHIDEGLSAVAAAREHQPALVAVGMPAELPDNLETRLYASQGTETMWHRELNAGRSEATIKLIDAAIALRNESLAVMDLALRANNEGLSRLAKIREGDGLPDVVADIFDLALLTRDASEHVSAVRVDPAAHADALDKTGKDLQRALSQEDAKKSLSNTKEVRDRYYTLTLEPLRDLRAFAAFAFRKDKGNQRRAAFVSGYTRRQNSRARNRRAAAVAAAAATVTPEE